MSKINPLTLITLNIFFPVIIFLGKGNIFQVGCFIIATVLVLMFRKIKTCIYFILIYSVLFLAMKIIDAIKIEFFTIFFGTSLYIVFRMLPVVMISWLLVSVYTSNELLSSLEKIHLPKKIMLSITIFKNEKHSLVFFSASAIFGISVSSRSYTCNYDC